MSGQRAGVAALLHRSVGGVYVIAEAGVNHDGRLDQALRLVDAAAAGGADAVKFQIFRADELATEDAGLAEYQRDGNAGSQRALLRGLELSDDAFDRVRTHCRAAEIDFLATPFSLADVPRLAVLDPPAVKIASPDLGNVPLLRAALGLRLPLIVSTGAAAADEIAAAVRRFEHWNATDRIILLHCVSSYPTPLARANLGAIAALASCSGLPVGFSDHTVETLTGALAVAAGARALEKHLTLDRSLSGPDHALSLEPRAMREYVARAREAAAALGNGVLGFDPSLEGDVRRVARKSIVAAIDLPAGTRLTADDLALKRPGDGLGPEHFDALLGRRLRRSVARDGRLTWDALELEPAACAR